MRKQVEKSKFMYLYLSPQLLEELSNLTEEPNVYLNLDSGKCSLVKQTWDQIDAILFANSPTIERPKDQPERIGIPMVAQRGRDGVGQTERRHSEIRRRCHQTRAVDPKQTQSIKFHNHPN